MKTKIYLPDRHVFSGLEQKPIIKKWLTIVFLLTFLPFYGQWVPVGTAFGPITDIYCINENTVVTVGDNGTITKTTDGGTTWVQKNFNTTYNLRKVQFASANVGYALGNYLNSLQGLLLKTIDGGENWNVVNSPNFSNVFGISVINENIFYIIGSGSLYSELLKTTNGGITFSTVCVNTVNENFQFINEQVGYFYSASGIEKTIDGGVTWIQVNNLWVYEMQFIDENVGFFRSGGCLFKTIDGGLTYDCLTGTTMNMGGIYASSQNVIWGITINTLLNGQPNYTMRGETLADGSFYRIDVDSPLFKAMHFANPIKGYAVDLNNIVYKNNTGELLSANKVEANGSPKIYPNPAIDKINVSFNETVAKSFQITMVDVLGKKIFSQTYENQSNVSIDAQNFDKGIYFLNIITSDGTVTKKIIIN